MSINELNNWTRYFNVEPQNSVEIQLAYLSLQVASFMGAKNKTIEDFLITAYTPPKKEGEKVEIDHGSIRAMFGL